MKKENSLQTVLLLGIVGLLLFINFGSSSDISYQVEGAGIAPPPRAAGTSTSLDALMQQIERAEQMMAEPPARDDIIRNLAPVMPTISADDRPPSAAVGLYSGEFVDACLRAAVEGRRSSPRCADAIEQLGQGR